MQTFYHIFSGANLHTVLSYPEDVDMFAFNLTDIFSNVFDDTSINSSIFLCYDLFIVCLQFRLCMHLITSLKKKPVRHYSLIIKPERELWVTGSWQLKLSRVVFPSITWLSKSWPSRTRSVEQSCQNCLNISIPGFSGQFVRSSLELPR